MLCCSNLKAEAGNELTKKLSEFRWILDCKWKAVYVVLRILCSSFYSREVFYDLNPVYHPKVVSFLYDLLKNKSLLSKSCHFSIRVAGKEVILMEKLSFFCAICWKISNYRRKVVYFSIICWKTSNYCH